MIETKSVSRKNYNQTTASVMMTFAQNNIDAHCKDSFVRISMIREALSIAGLRNMLDGYRTQPITSASNPNGYSERVTMIGQETDNISGEITSIPILLEEDDFYCFEHDKGRLFLAVTEMFHKDLRYLVPHDIAKCDGVAIYVKIMEHLNGQRGRDADVAKEVFTKYKMNEAITFKQERAKFEEVFKTLEYVIPFLLP